MADAWGRLTGQCGIALVSGGAGFTNAAAALCTAQAAELPLVLLSGHAGAEGDRTRRLPGAAPGRDGGTRRQGVVDGQAPPRRSGTDVAEAVRIALSGRRGPVHLSLPFDLLDEKVEDAPALWPARLGVRRRGRSRSRIAPPPRIRGRACRARSGPWSWPGRSSATPAICRCCARSRRRLGVPVVPMESPRGINDPRLGAFAEVLRQADLIVLLGKALDFTLRFGDAPFVDPACRFIAIDPEEALIERVAREKGERLACSAVADAAPAAHALIERAPAGADAPRAPGQREVARAIAYRPAGLGDARLARARQGASRSSFAAALSAVLDTPARRHPGVRRRRDRAMAAGHAVARAAHHQRPRRLDRRLDPVRHRRARRRTRQAPVIAVHGRRHVRLPHGGVRHGRALRAAVRGGRRQRRRLERRAPDPAARVRRGTARTAASCCPRATTWWRRRSAVTASWSPAAGELAPALERALASGKPACVNVMIERVPAPIIRRQTS